MQYVRIGQWDNVVSFSINSAEDHIVMTMVGVDDRELAYETFKVSGKWNEPSPIPSLNALVSDNVSLGGLFMAGNERRIYFHANCPDGVGGYDIYHSDLTANGWGDPILDSEISTPEDDTYPSAVNGDQTIYFLRHQVVSDLKLEKKTSERKSVYFVNRQPSGKWGRPEPATGAVNFGYVQDAAVLPDGVTVYFSVRKDRKEPAIINGTRTILSNIWILPEPLFVDDDEYDYYSPNFAGGKVYAIRSVNKKRVRRGSIIMVDCPQKWQPEPFVVDNGKVLTMGSHKPVDATITVYNPTTMAPVGVYRSSSFDGAYEVSNPSRKNYIVDVRRDGYSYASFQIDYKDGSKPQLPTTIELFDTIQICVSVYDSEIFRPLDSKVVAVRTADKMIFRSKSIGDGQYLFNLPIGSDYNIIATATAFNENKFLFKLAGDIVFSRYEREISLDPQKLDYNITVVDAETKAPLNANLQFVNLNRDENITSPASQMNNGKTVVKLRVGDGYDLTVSGVKSYSFRNLSLSVTPQSVPEIYVELIPLRPNSSVRLNNINFETASADIMPESYSELDRVVKLMVENPELRFEISAHTDNVGSAKYNMLLSERRAQSVTEYLIQSGIPESRLVPRGYGMTMPAVENDTEENRAINRRVEFKIVSEE